MVGRDAEVAGRRRIVGVGRGSMCAAAAGAEGGVGCVRRYVVGCWGGGAGRDEETTAAMGGRDLASLGDRP